MVNGQRMEPLEEVVCEIEDEFSGPVIDALSLRRGEVTQTLRKPCLFCLLHNQAGKSCVLLQCTLFVATFEWPAYATVAVKAHAWLSLHNTLQAAQ